MELRVSLIICFYYLVGYAALRKELSAGIKKRLDRHPAVLFTVTVMVITIWPYIVADNVVTVLKTSFRYRKMYVAEVWFNTTAEGRVVDAGEDYPVCYFGPFKSVDDGLAWLEQTFCDDTDVYEDQVAPFSRRHMGAYINSV